MARRDQSDTRWKEVKKKVKARDRGCRLCRIISTKDYVTLRNNAGPELNVLDPAHIFDVSTDPEFCYEVNNVVLLNRYSHNNLDNCRDPITGDHISYEERENWWKRLSGDQWNYMIELMSEDN